MRQIFALAAFTAALCLVLPSTSPPLAAQNGSEVELSVMTFNVWHGLRSGESRKRFPGEDPERFEKRFAWQIEEMKRLAPGNMVGVQLGEELFPASGRSRAVDGLQRVERAVELLERERCGRFGFCGREER